MTAPFPPGANPGRVSSEHGAGQARFPRFFRWIAYVVPSQRWAPPRAYGGGAPQWSAYTAPPATKPATKEEGRVMAKTKAAWKDEVALVTGGASGIGRALSEELASRGAEVVLADRQHALAEDVARAIREKGGRATACELDVCDLDAFTRSVDGIVKRTGHVDYLFNNAGIAVGGEVSTYKRADWDDVFDVNLRGVAYGIQAVYPHMVARGHGHIVNTASVAGLLPSPEAASYTASKHAVVGLSKALRLEGKRHGVRVSVLCPGVIRTPILTGGKFGRMNVPISEDKIMTQWEKLRPI